MPFMPPVYTEEQLRRIWTHETYDFLLNLPHAFSLLYANNPQPSEGYLTELTSYLRGRIQHESRLNRTNVSQSQFVQWCVEARVVRSLMRVSEKQGLRYKYARPYALDTLGFLSRAGTPVQNKAVVKEIKEEGGLNTFMKSFRSEFCTQRAAAVMAVRAICCNASFSELLSPEEIADLLHEVLTYALRGYEPILEELNDPQKVFQIELMVQGTVESARIYAPRWSGMSEENACWICHACLCRERRPSRRECLAIIKHRPEILDLLLKLALRRRTEWYPESVADATSMETLLQLLMTPYGVVPGLHKRSRGALDTNAELYHEWEAAVDCWKIFVGTEKWRERLLGIWKKVEREEYKHIWEKFEMTDHYLAQTSPEQEALTEAVESRGFLRICVLRTLIYMTYLPPAIIPLPVYLSFLATAYKACQKVPLPTGRPTFDPGHLEGNNEGLIHSERVAELCRTPISVSNPGLSNPACFMVAPEPVLGPTLIMRILSHIVSEGLVESLSAIADWIALPAGTPSDTALSQVRQITSLSVLGKIVRTALTRRLKECRERGSNRRLDRDHVLSAYLAGVELAVAVRSLDQVASGEERKEWTKEAKSIQQEIVQYLGSITDLWGELDEWELSRWSAEKALESLDTVDVARAKRDGWNVSKMKQKNRERLGKAWDVLRTVR